MEEYCGGKGTEQSQFGSGKASWVPKAPHVGRERRILLTGLCHQGEAVRFAGTHMNDRYLAQYLDEKTEDAFPYPGSSGWRRARIERS